MKNLPIFQNDCSVYGRNLWKEQIIIIQKNNPRKEQSILVKALKKTKTDDHFVFQLP
jgi:hypothetical protein